MPPSCYIYTSPHAIIRVVNMLVDRSIRLVADFPGIAGRQGGIEQKDPSSVILMHSKPYHAYHKRRTTMTVKILLDTDIGSDIDDAVCLAYLLAQPACELLGITTVSGEADKRAMLASV